MEASVVLRELEPRHGHEGGGALGDRPLRWRAWAIEIKRGLATINRALRVAFDDVQPDRAVIVHGRDGRFPKGDVEAMDLANLLADLSAR